MSRVSSFFSKINYRDVLVRAEKTLAQAFVASEPTFAVAINSPSTATLYAVVSSFGAALVSALHNAALQGFRKVEVIASTAISDVAVEPAIVAPVVSAPVDTTIPPTV